MDPLQPLITSFYADGRPRVWSLTITVFGDCVQPRGGRISTARLGQIMSRIGIESGTLRTALSRLSSDGWVEARREGRTSNYSLSPKGVVEFGPATARIYAAPHPGPVAQWCFGTEPMDNALRFAGGWLVPGTEAHPRTCLVGQLQPGAATQIWQALDPDHRQSLIQMAQDLRAINMASLGPLDALVARVLLVHRWRRLILRWPHVPPELFPKDVAPSDLHSSMAQVYEKLSPAAENWLDHAQGGLPAMPAPDDGFKNRFKPEQTP